MSVVVAIKENGRVYVGSDSQMTCGSSKVTLSNPSNYKIWNVENTDTALMAGVGSAREICAIKAYENLIDKVDYKKGYVDYDILIDEVEPLIREILIDHKYLNPTNPYKDIESRYLFAINDEMYTIEKGAVYAHEGYVVLGSGSSESMGSLASMDDKISPKERIIKAIKATSLNDLYVDYPIIITDTISRKYDVVTKENEQEYIAKCREEYECLDNDNE